MQVLRLFLKINFHAVQYMDWVIDCVGISVWEHSEDYEYWTNLEFRDKRKRKYFLSKDKLVKLLNNNVMVGNML